MIEPSQWTTFANLVLQPRNVTAEAIFVHGWGDQRDALIALVGQCYRQGRAKLIILNGHEHYEIGGRGVSSWRSALVERHGVPPAAIQTIPAADYTGAEAEALMEFAKKENLKSVVIVSHPIHLVRAMLTQIGAVRKHGLDLKLYPQTLADIDWNEVIKIHSLTAHQPETTRRIARLFGESARIARYNQHRAAGDDSFPIATIEEGIEYFRKMTDVKLKIKKQKSKVQIKAERFDI